MLQLRNITYRVQGRTLLEDASALLNKDERVGLVGRNGSGKTTLLKLIMGEVQCDLGDVYLPEGLRVGTVPQQPPGGETSLIDTVLAADQERIALLAEAEEAHDSHDAHRIAEIHERLATIRADSAPARAARILAGLGFDEDAQQRPCSTFSGGWRMRVALAALLFSEPDLLLLDEPTNHLDLEAALWLENHLRSYPGTLLIVSHDRDLLNRAVNKIVHLEHCTLTTYSGNYDRFERLRAEKLQHQAALVVKQEARRAHMQAFVDRFRYQANKARQAQSRLKAIAKLNITPPLNDQQAQSFDFPAPTDLAPPLIALDRVAIGYEPGKPILKNLSMRIDMDDRIALLGANGNGKTTLARLFAGRLGIDSGEQHRHRRLKVGYFAQDQADELDLEATPLQLLGRLQPSAPDGKLRAQLGRFGFGVDRAGTKAGNLSGGERARLLFALMTRDAPQLLILDEPTNHLDMDSRQALVEAIAGFQGAVILVSHDNHLVSLVADRLWLVAGGGVETYEGDLEDYRKLLLGRRSGNGISKPEAKAADAKETASDGAMKRQDSSGNKKERRRAAAAQREATVNLRKAAKEAEAKIEKLTAQRQTLEARLADPQVYEGPTAKLQEITVRLGEVKARVAEAEAAWLATQEALEQSGTA